MTKAEMGEPPVISVVMPVRNVERTLARAVGSLLAQSEPRFELLLADDGSSDGTRAILAGLRDPRVRLAAEGPRRGLAARLNELVALARGRFIARMDGDDIAYPERFARQFAFLDANPGVDLVGTGAVAFRPSGAALGAFRLPEDHAAICARPALGFAMAHPTWMGRADWFRRFPYPSEARRGQDQATLLSAYRDSRFANLPDILLAYSQDTPSLESIVGGRWHYTRALARQAAKSGEPGLLLTGAMHQGLRTVATVPLLLAGGGDAILARRFRPLSEDEGVAFRAVWSRWLAEG